jgi:hypothetical protein
MSDLDGAWQTVAAARGVRDEARLGQRRALFELQRLDAEIEDVRRIAATDDAARRRLAALERARVAQQEEIATRGQAIVDANQRLTEDVVASFDAAPQSLISGLDDATPFLLIPLRIETRFGSSDGTPLLRIRIFLDDVAIAQHEKTLTAGEVSGGKSYWSDRIRANAEPEARARAAIVSGAWTQLAIRHGAYRASWIARATMPLNFTDQLVDPAAAQYGPIDVKPQAWSEAPRSFVMPDRFVVGLRVGGEAREVMGALIPDDLPMGPDPLQAEGVFTRDEQSGRLLIDPALRWLVDFDAAVAVGMALQIPLLPYEVNGFSRILVLGLRLSSSPADNTALVERTLQAQRFSRGLSVVPQGTPTNNTDEATSGLTTPSESIDESLALELDPAPFVVDSDHFKKSDGQRLAEALGLSLDLVRALPAATGTDVADALAMNRALWSGTIGDFAHDLLEPLISPATIQKLRLFFGTYVSGRGLLPAVRVGSQPYGIVVTSALGLWTFRADETGDDGAFWDAVLARLRTLRETWTSLVPRVAFVGDGADPFATLLNVMGLQASSVEYYARKAISHDYLANYTRFRGTPQAVATELWEEMQSAVAPHLAAIGLNAFVPFRLRQLIFWREHDQLTGPLIDDDPRVPFSEQRGIRLFDGARNYIDWFRTATSDEIRQQVFKDAAGNAVAPPGTLLYRLLRASFLAELGRAGRVLVTNLSPEVFAQLEAEPIIANIGSARSFSTADVLNVDASRIGATSARISVADHLIASVHALETGVPPLAEAAGLADLTQALGMLARRSTAQLERLVAEHIDLCSYRLDAWIHGLFARRLLQLREHAVQSERPWTVHLGCYGWVENVKPSTLPRQRIARDTLPADLRDEVTGDVFADPANGGFVHAPSLTHAVTAAVLRNAYLTHAEPARADLMAVNLSSGRVRNAMRYIDGLRGGQELAALLGYQFERGLHEQHPGVELDAFIYVFRERFPFTSGKLTAVPDGTASESMEARNVVNGYDLLEHVRGRTYPFGLAGLPDDGSAASPAAKAQAAAIRAEIDALAEAMDAMADLMLAESVHQVVQGNYDRAGGVLQSITEGTSPPDPQVIETPRSGRSLTFRVAVPLDPGAMGGWHPSLTPRAAGNAALNHWLSTRLPAPDDIEWQVTQDGSAPTFVSLTALGLEPIDCVLMAGDHLGDFSSELERFLVHDYRVGHALSDAMITVIKVSDVVSPPGAPVLEIDPRIARPGKFALATLMPLLKALARLVTKGRAINARDFELASEAQEIEPANPKGFDDGTPLLKDLAELKNRLEAGYSLLDAAKSAVATFLATTVAPLYAAFQADPSQAANPQWPGVLTTLRDLMVSICRVGVAEALPTAGLDVNGTNIDAMVAQGKATVAVVTARLVAARAALDTTFTDPLPADPTEAAHVRAFRTEGRVQQYTDAGRKIFGASFLALPLVRVHAATQPELSAALATPVETDRLKIEEWAQSLERVRNTMRDLSLVAAYRDWTGGGPAPVGDLVALQLPVRAGVPWIGSTFGAALPDGEAASIVLCAPMPSIAQPVCGLLLDEWTELVPSSRETTGIAFHFNRPNASPPQALLLAVAPRLAGRWQWTDLVAVIEDTFERARMRAVEPDMIADTPYFQALPAIVSEFSAFNIRSTVFAQKATAVKAADPG